MTDTVPSCASPEKIPNPLPESREHARVRALADYIAIDGTVKFLAHTHGRGETQAIIDLGREEVVQALTKSGIHHVFQELDIAYEPIYEIASGLSAEAFFEKCIRSFPDWQTVFEEVTAPNWQRVKTESPLYQKYMAIHSTLKRLEEANIKLIPYDARHDGNLALRVQDTREDATILKAYNDAWDKCWDEIADTPGISPLEAYACVEDTLKRRNDPTYLRYMEMSANAINVEDERKNEARILSSSHGEPVLIMSGSNHIKERGALADQFRNDGYDVKTLLFYEDEDIKRFIADTKVHGERMPDYIMTLEDGILCDGIIAEPDGSFTLTCGTNDPGRPPVASMSLSYPSV